jgi:hypothetical protein
LQKQLNSMLPKKYLQKTIYSQPIGLDLFSSFRLIVQFHISA